MNGLKKKTMMIKNKHPYKNSRKNRFFQPKKKYSGIWISSIIFFDAAFVFLMFYILNSPLMVKHKVLISISLKPHFQEAHYIME